MRTSGFETSKIFQTLCQPRFDRSTPLLAENHASKADIFCKTCKHGGFPDLKNRLLNPMLLGLLASH